METGMEFLKIVSPFYFVISLKLMADGVLRGAGAMKSFMIATFSDLLLRVILVSYTHLIFTIRVSCRLREKQALRRYLILLKICFTK